MRVRTFLAAGAFAVTAMLGSAGSALADDHDGNRNEGGFRACGEFAGAGDGHAYYGRGCAAGYWLNDNNGHYDNGHDGNRHEDRHNNGHDNGHDNGHSFGH